MMTNNIDVKKVFSKYPDIHIKSLVLEANSFISLKVYKITSSKYNQKKKIFFLPGYISTIYSWKSKL